MTEPRHSVAIRFIQPISQHEHPKVYAFETLAERNAFLKGVEEALGWTEYEIVQTKARHHG